MNFLKTNLIVILAGILVTIFAVQWYSSYKMESEIVTLEETVSNKDKQLSQLEENLKQAEATQREMEKRYSEADQLDDTLDDELELVNEELFIKEQEEQAKLNQINKMKERIKEIALKKPESLARLINANNLDLFKRAKEATIIR